MSERLVILGGGESGVGAALLAQSKGYEVFLSDTGALKDNYRKELQEAKIEFEENKHSWEKISKADKVVKSPGIPDKAETIKKLKAQNTPIVSEIEFASAFTNARKIGITGSNGKTTTTLWTYHILSKAGLNVGLAGNVGKSFARQVAVEKFENYVLELSSFQLDDLDKFKCEIAILLNITPDHLDRYEYKFENYIRSKFRITNNQSASDYFIYCADDQVILDYMKDNKINSKKIPFSIQNTIEGEGAYLNQNQIQININQKPITMTIEQLALQGKHNVYNAMASSLAARIVDIKKESVRESLMDFTNVEHRLEPVATINGIEFINDSKATNVNSVWYALESMTKPVVWIVGGVDKGNDYAQLFDLVKSKVKAIVALGTDNSKILENFSDKVEKIAEAKTMQEAVAYSYKFGSKGDAVLLSPACASFDLFKNYEDRGQQFKAGVRAL